MFNWIKRFDPSPWVHEFTNMSVNNLCYYPCKSLISGSVRLMILRANTSERSFSALSSREVVVNEFQEEIKRLYDLPPQEFAKLGRNLADEDFVRSCSVRTVLCYRHICRVDSLAVWARCKLAA
jgi:hypothetical protein